MDHEIFAGSLGIYLQWKASLQSPYPWTFHNLLIENLFGPAPFHLVRSHA